MTDYTSKDLLN